MLTQMIEAGFQFEVAGEKLRVRPAELLTDVQVDYIQQHKQEILAELQEQAEVIPILWPEFVRQCVALGATADEVRAMFNEIDIQDLCEEPASKLHLHAQTIVKAIKRERR